MSALSSLGCNSSFFTRLHTASFVSTSRVALQARILNTGPISACGPSFSEVVVFAQIPQLVILPSHGTNPGLSDSSTCEAFPQMLSPVSSYKMSLLMSQMQELRSRAHLHPACHDPGLTHPEEIFGPEIYQLPCRELLLCETLTSALLFMPLKYPGEHCY